MRAKPDGAEKCGVVLRLYEDDGGFSSLGMLVALGLTLVLIFSGLRVYRVQSVTADIQDVADVAVLAAENQVSSFVSVARICDATVLSFSLAGIVVGLIGVAALCVPVTSGYAEPLLEAAQNIFKLRNSFAARAAEGLEVYQRCLPFLATVRATSVAQANSVEGSTYIALAILSPFEGASLGDFGVGEEDEVIGDAREQADDVRKDAEEAERLAKEAEELKRQAWLLDCGAEDKCLRERASRLAGLSGTKNPHYASVDAWSFSVPLTRCRAYYKQRLQAEEHVAVRNAEEAADSALRSRIYEYAVDVFADAYAKETDEGFSCYFPLLPRNMAELRKTELYTEAVYPMKLLDDGKVIMHAHSGCPQASSCAGRGSISFLEASEYEVCSSCKFVPSSLANVCAATSVVQTGFEYYYRQIAELAEQYEDLQKKVQEQAAPAKKKVKRLVQALADVLKQLGGERLEINPPGAQGAICLVVGLGDGNVGKGYSSALLGSSVQVGTRVAVSAATLLEDDREGAPSLISGIPAQLGLTGADGTNDPGVGGTVLQLVLSLWEKLLEVYNSGQDALESAAEGAIGTFSWRSSSGLGAWAAKLVRNALKDAGLGKAPTTYVKPVLVNTGLVAAADNNSRSDAFLTVKQTAPSVAQGGAAVQTLRQLFSSAGGSEAEEELPRGGIVITLAQELLGGESPLSIVFSLLSAEDATSDAGSTAWGFAIGGLLEAAGNEGRRDWR